MRKYVYKPKGFVPHVCPGCQDARCFRVHRVMIEKHRWPLKTVSSPYGQLLECCECGYRTLFERSVLAHASDDPPADPFRGLLAWRGDESYLVQLVNAYRDVSAGLANEKNTWALLTYAMECVHFETRAPRDGDWLRMTTLSRTSTSLIGILVLILAGSLSYTGLAYAIDLPDDGIIAVIIFFFFMFGLLAWVGFSVLALVRESREKARHLRERRRLMNRFVHCLRGLEIDGQMLDEAFERGRKQQIVTAELSAVKVLEQHAEGFASDNPALADWV